MLEFVDFVAEAEVDFVVQHVVSELLLLWVLKLSGVLNFGLHARLARAEELEVGFLIEIELRPREDIADLALP